MWKLTLTQNSKIDKATAGDISFTVIVPHGKVCLGCKIIFSWGYVFVIQTYE